MRRADGVLLSVSSDRIGLQRHRHLRRQPGGAWLEVDVTLVAPGRRRPVEGVEVVQAQELGRGRFRRFASRYDAVLAQQLRSYHDGACTSRHEGRLRPVRPLVSENLPLFAPGDARGGSAWHGYAVSTGIQRVALASGDAFVCAGERQRDLWLGALAAFDRIGLDAYNEDPTLRSVVEVVPFGLADELRATPSGWSRGSCRESRSPTGCSCGPAACGTGSTR